MLLLLLCCPQYLQFVLAPVLEVFTRSVHAVKRPAIVLRCKCVSDFRLRLYSAVGNLTNLFSNLTPHYVTNLNLGGPSDVY